MSYNRFVLINSFFHLSDNEEAAGRGEPGFDPWSKLRPVLDSLNAKFKLYFVPEQLVCVDESMVGMKNRMVYIQYMPNKRHCRFGIKKFEICDSQTSYVLHVELYSGRDFDIRSEDGQGSAVVTHLLEVCGLLNNGYHMITDNFYTKVSLARALYAKRTMLTGTIRQNSVGFPKSFPPRMAVQTAAYKKRLHGCLRLQGQG